MGCGGSKAAATSADKGAPEADSKTLLTSPKEQPADTQKPITEATDKLKSVFAAQKPDAEGTVAADALATSLRSQEGDVSKLLEGATMNPLSYMLQELDILAQGRVLEESFLSLATTPMALAEGQLAKVASTGEVAKVLKRTTTDLQLEMPDRSTKWVDIDDVRMAHEQPTELAELAVGDTAMLASGERGEVTALTTADVKLLLADGSSKWCCLEDLTKVAAELKAQPAAPRTIQDQPAIEAIPATDVLLEESGIEAAGDTEVKYAGWQCFKLC